MWHGQTCYISQIKTKRVGAWPLWIFSMVTQIFNVFKFIFAKSSRKKIFFCWGHTNTLGTFLRRSPQVNILMWQSLLVYNACPQPQTEATVLVSPSLLQIDTFGKWCRCLHNVCYVKLKKRRYLDKCRLSAPADSTAPSVLLQGLLVDTRLRKMEVDSSSHLPTSTTYFIVSS